MQILLAVGLCGDAKTEAAEISRLGREHGVSGGAARDDSHQRSAVGDVAAAAEDIETGGDVVENVRTNPRDKASKGLLADVGHMKIATMSCRSPWGWTF
jgi:hypothetical protein